MICTAGLIKPTTMAGDYGHLGYRPLAFAPNQTYRDFTCDFAKADPDTRPAGAWRHERAVPGAAAAVPRGR